MVVHRSSLPSRTALQETVVLTQSSIQVHRSDTALQPSIFELGSLAPELIQYDLLNHPQKCMDVLREAKRLCTMASIAFK